MKTFALSILLASGALAAVVPSTAAPVCKFKRDLTDLPLEGRDLTQTTWNPPSNLATPLKEVWDHEISTYSNPLGFKNYGFDQVMDGKGKINYCVRWDSNKSVSAAQRTQIEAAVRKQFNKWISVLAGFEKFPYKTVDVNVVGWAVRDKNLIQGDTSGIQVYTDTDGEGIPQCAEDCGRFFHQDGDYSKCPSGTARHYGKPHPLYILDIHANHCHRSISLAYRRF